MSNPKMKDPRDLGLFMPGEWEKHTCCWMAWPARVDLWPNIEATKKAYADVANTIAEFEPVNLLVLPSMLDDARAYLSKNVEIIEMSIDDSWTRDSGPNFLINDSGLLAGSTWEFNAWGDKFRPYDQDALMGSRIPIFVEAFLPNFQLSLSLQQHRVLCLSCVVKQQDRTLPSSPHRIFSARLLSTSHQALLLRPQVPRQLELLLD